MIISGLSATMSQFSSQTAEFEPNSSQASAVDQGPEMSRNSGELTDFFHESFFSLTVPRPFSYISCRKQKHLVDFNARPQEFPEERRG
jgi:hypothetical protein